MMVMMVVMMIVMVVATAARLMIMVMSLVMGRFACVRLGLGAHRLGPQALWL